MKKIYLAVILSSIIMSVVSCSSENSIKQTESEIKDFQIIDTRLETTKTSETATEAIAVSHNAWNEKEDYPVPDNFHMIHSIQGWENGLFIKGIAKSQGTELNVSAASESQGKTDRSFYITDSTYDMNFHTNSTYCDGEYLYIAGDYNSGINDVFDGFIIKYNMSENKIIQTEYLKSHLLDMDYDKNKNQFVFISREGVITFIDENFKPVLNFSISDKIANDLPGEMRIENIAVDSSSNIYVCCAERMTDYNEYSWISVSVFDSDCNYTGTSVIKREDLQGSETDSEYGPVLGYIGLSSLKEGNAGLFYKTENELRMAKIQSDSTVRDDLSIIDDCSDINVYCKCSKSDYLIEKKDSESEGTIIETWNVLQDTPDEIHIYPDMIYMNDMKHLPWNNCRYLYGDTLYYHYTKKNSDWLYNTVDCYGNVISEVQSENLSPELVYATDKGAVLFAENNAVKGTVIREKKGNQIKDILTISDHFTDEISRIAENNGIYTVIINSSEGKLLELYDKNGELLESKLFGFNYYFFSIWAQDNLLNILLYDNEFKKLSYNIKTSECNITDCMDLKKQFCKEGVSDYAIPNDINCDGGKYDMYMMENNGAGSVMYGYSVSDGTITKIISSDETGSRFRNAVVLENDMVYIYEEQNQYDEIKVFEKMITAVE